jgi:hypothetical protein
MISVYDKPAPTFQLFWMGGFEGACHINSLRLRLDMVASTQHHLYVDSDYARLRDAARPQPAVLDRSPGSHAAAWQRESIPKLAQSGWKRGGSAGSGHRGSLLYPMFLAPASGSGSCPRRRGLAPLYEVLRMGMGRTNAYSKSFRLGLIVVDEIIQECRLTVDTAHGPIATGDPDGGQCSFIALDQNLHRLPATDRYGILRQRIQQKSLCRKTASAGLSDRTDGRPSLALRRAPRREVNIGITKPFWFWNPIAGVLPDRTLGRWTVKRQLTDEPKPADTPSNLSTPSPYMRKHGDWPRWGHHGRPLGSSTRRFPAGCHFHPSRYPRRNVYVAEPCTNSGRDADLLRGSQPPGQPPRQADRGKPHRRTPAECLVSTSLHRNLVRFGRTAVLVRQAASR